LYTDVRVEQKCTLPEILREIDQVYFELGSVQNCRGLAE